MHEFGIVSSVLDTVLSSAQHAHATRVLAVTLRIGALTQAQEESLRFAYDVLTEDTLAQGSQLIVEHIAPRSHCHDCGHDFDHDGRDVRCPYCSSISTELIAGRELAIASIDVDIPDELSSDLASSQHTHASEKMS